MKKIEFQDYPSTETPLNAENLNSMQDNIESEINEIPMKVLSDGYNIDTLKQSGTYAVFNATGTLPNAFSPTNNNIFIQSFMWGDNWGRQILYDVRSNLSYSRAINNGNWQAWAQITMN